MAGDESPARDRGAPYAAAKRKLKLRRNFTSPRTAPADPSLRAPRDIAGHLKLAGRSPDFLHLFYRFRRVIAHCREGPTLATSVAGNTTLGAFAGKGVSHFFSSRIDPERPFNTGLGRGNHKLAIAMNQMFVNWPGISFSCFAAQGFIGINFQGRFVISPARHISRRVGDFGAIINRVKMASNEMAGNRTKCESRFAVKSFRINARKCFIQRWSSVEVSISKLPWTNFRDAGMFHFVRYVL